jgi:predicted MFS family arabinose efflux permease
MKGGVPRVAPEGLVAALFLAFLGTAGIFYVNIMSALVSGLVDGLHFSAAAAGRIAACNTYGAAAGAFCAVLIVRRVAWRPAAVALLLTLIGLDLVSTQIHGVLALTVVRSLHGLAGGLLVGVSYSVFARTGSPDRCFGMLMVVQSSLGGLGLMFLPRLVPLFGASVLFLALALFSAVALSMLPFLPAYARPTDAPAPNSAPVETLAAVPRDAQPPAFPYALPIALLAVFFFQSGNMALAAYIIELGRAYGLSLDFISTWIGLSGWLATVGSVLVVVFGTRWGRTLPIAIGGAAAVVGNFAFHGSASAFVFAAANVATAITWFFVSPYLLGLCATFDRTGRSAALAGLFSKLGFATGPYVASLLVGSGTAASYGSIIDWSVGALALSVVLGVAAARRVI